MKINKNRLIELAGIKKPLNEGYAWEVSAASEILSLLAHPDMKHSMDNLSDVLEDSEFMAIKKLYDGLYTELKKYE